MTRSPNTSPQRQRGASRTLILVAVLALVAMLALGAGGTFYFMRGGSGSAEAAEQPPPEPTFVKVDPMTVNLAHEARVLYIGLSLAVADQSTVDTLTAHMPEVRNRMLITLSDQSADKLTTADGKRAIAKTLRTALRQPYTKQGKPLAINDVLFTDFIVQ